LSGANERIQHYLIRPWLYGVPYKIVHVQGIAFAIYIEIWGLGVKQAGGQMACCSASLFDFAWHENVRQAVNLDCLPLKLAPYTLDQTLANVQIFGLDLLI
jgi:hypothetical protein